MLRSLLWRIDLRGMHGETFFFFFPGNHHALQPSRVGQVKSKGNDWCSATTKSSGPREGYVTFCIELLKLQSRFKSPIKQRSFKSIFLTCLPQLCGGCFFLVGPPEEKTHCFQANLARVCIYAFRYSCSSAALFLIMHNNSNASELQK